MRPNDGKHIAKGKGVYREVESEGSRRQTSGLTNSNWRHGRYVICRNRVSGLVTRNNRMPLNIKCMTNVCSLSYCFVSPMEITRRNGSLHSGRTVSFRVKCLSDGYSTRQQAFSPFASFTSANEIVCPIASVRFSAFVLLPFTSMFS